jgi:hypothetical protein
MQLDNALIIVIVFAVILLVVIVLPPADDHFEIELEGALAGMLALAHSGNVGPGGATVSNVFRSSVKVVAGARITSGPT